MAIGRLWGALLALGLLPAAVAPAAETGEVWESDQGAVQVRMVAAETDSSPVKADPASPPKTLLVPKPLPPVDPNDRLPRSAQFGPPKPMPKYDETKNPTMLDLLAPIQQLPKMASKNPFVEEPAVPPPAPAIVMYDEESESGQTDDDQPWTFFNLPSLECRGISIRGWFDGGYTWNPDYPADRFNGPVTFNDRANELQMNQLYFIAERVTQTDECNPWDVGGRIDFMYGTDSRFLGANGLETDWNGGQRFYGAALPQLFADVAYDRWLFRVGHFYSIVGYEVCTQPDNFFYSHAYTFQYGEPFTHTGFLAKYTLNDRLALTAGLHRGWDQWEDNNDELGFLGGVTWTLPNDKTSVAVTVVASDEQPDVESCRTLVSTVVTHKFNDRLRYVFQNDLGWETNVTNSIGDVVDAEWYGLVQYLIFDLNPRWSLGARYEWFSDDDGVRVAGLGDARGRGDLTGIDLSAVPAHWQEISLGVNFKPHANVLVRNELRWDWADPIVDVDGGPFDDLSDRSQFLLGSDVVVRF